MYFNTNFKTESIYSHFYRASGFIDTPVSLTCTLVATPLSHVRRAFLMHTRQSQLSPFPVQVSFKAYHTHNTKSYSAFVTVKGIK